MNGWMDEAGNINYHQTRPWVPFQGRKTNGGREWSVKEGGKDGIK